MCDNYIKFARIKLNPLNRNIQVLMIPSSIFHIVSTFPGRIFANELYGKNEGKVVIFLLRS